MAAALPPLILLAGTSEAGKSTAGQHLARCGARRFKIRTILLSLTTGIEVNHDDVATREGFDANEFLTCLRGIAATAAEPVVVVESFIDVQLARLTRSLWAARCDVVFITAPLDVRVHRHADDAGLTYEEADRIVRSKDARKRVMEQQAGWRELADYWIVNDGGLATFTSTLDEIMIRSLHSTQTGHDS